MADKGDKSAAHPPEGSLVETRCLKGPKSTIVPFAEPRSGPKSRTGFGVSYAKDGPGVFVDRPTLRASVAQGLFYGGSGRRAVARTRPAFPKNAYGPVGIPLIRGASGAGR